MDSWDWLSVVLSAGVLLAIGGMSIMITRRLPPKSGAVQVDDLSPVSGASGQFDLILQRLDDLERTIPGQLEALLAARMAHSDADGEPHAIMAGSDETSEYVVVEGIAHELKTPLAAIKASAAMLADMYRQEFGVGIGEEIETEVRSVGDDVTQCEEILLVFRHVIAGLRWANEEPGLLAQGIQRAYEAVTKVSGRRTQLELQLPEDVPGFSPRYLAALVRPLIVNAVEASPERGGKVVVKLTDNPGMIELVVENLANRPVNASMFAADGSSSKPDHRGLGIRTARILANARRGRLTYNVQDELVRAQVTLPKENV